MKDIMIDLETMGTTPNAAIVSIGACYFDINTGDIGDTFHSIMSWDNIFKGQPDRNVDTDTLKWWIKQSNEARLSILDGDKDLGIELMEFSRWVYPGCKPWGNGATFDISMLENAFNMYEVEVPWKFWDICDVRTMVRIAGAIDYDWKKDGLLRQGTHHNALDDAIYQAQYVSAIWQQLPIQE